MNKILLDTNVLVYAYDQDNPDKQMVAATLVDRLIVAKISAVSTQVLAEFYNATTRKLAYPLTHEEAVEQIEGFLKVFSLLQITGYTLIQAIKAVKAHQLQFWDSLIWCVAKENEIPTLFTEDFSEGEVIEGVSIVNPFANGFKLEAWLKT